MYVNERDQINYHGFLRALREMNQVSQGSVGKGICTVSGMNRFENGNRVAEKLMRDRLTARLGISGEKYEDYLQPKEYVRWEQRLRIVKAIEKRDLSTAKRELDSYEKLKGLNRVNVQFVDTMRFMILTLENATEEVLLECINKAVKCTVPNVAKALAGEHLLADQEVNLIAEKIRLCPPKKVVRDTRAWRILEYEKLITYMDNSRWEKLQKAKVYPKVVHYICQLLLEKETTEEELRRGLELCHNAIELLRDSSRLYYFIELTEARRALATCLIELGVDSAEETKLKEMLTENNQWEGVFKELYAEYKVAPYMSDFCYLYYETECHNMVEVIETRRKMLGLSRVKLGDGICSDKTIIRFEREGMNPSIEVVRCLFDRMGMCAEYRRTQIIVADSDSLMLYLDLTDNVNGLRNEAAKICLEELEAKIDMKILYNRQEIERVYNLLALRDEKIDRKELFMRVVKSFEATLPIEAIENGLKYNSLYLTRVELMCAHDIAFYGEGKSANVCNEYIKEKCEEMLEGFQPSMISEYELLLTRCASELGDSEKHDESIQISKIVLKECLSFRRINILPENLYNIIWNIKKTIGDEYLVQDYIKDLEKCICISSIIKAYNWKTFFQTKIIV